MKAYYQVYPTNYALLHDYGQDSLIESFKKMMNSIENEIVITCRREVKEVRHEDTVFEAALYSFYIESRERLDELLQEAGFLYQPLLNKPPTLIDPGRVLVKPKYIIYEGKVYKVLTAYKLPTTLVEGFVQDILPLVDELKIWIKPIPRYVAVKLLKKKHKLLRALMAGYEHEGRPPEIEVEEEYTIVDQLLQEIVRREVKLFTFRMIAVVSDDSREEVATRADMLKKELESLGFEVDSPAYLQWLMYELKEPRPLFIDTHILGAFFPFISNTLMETEEVFLGISRIDRSPVFYDAYIHINYNIVVLGVPGAGKSMFGKVMVYRYARKFGNEFDFYIIDPENEYLPLLRALNAQVIGVKPRHPLGLDPLKLLPKSYAVDVIAVLANVPPKLYGELASLVNKCDTVKDVYESASTELKDYLRGILEGPESFIFEGSTVNIGNRVGILLRDVESGKVKNIESSPVSRRKMVVVDEAWLLLRNPNAAKWMETISRSGRKRNVAFLFLTQQSQDVLKNPIGNLIVRNAATKLLLMQDVDAIDLIAKEFKLSEAEKQELLRAQPGEGILIAEHTKLSLKITLTRKEYSMFTIRPSEIH